ncbi:MAG TPA: hypothetical protein PLR06_12900 [Cyclobacteriaceae bacterium]|nr:hypothetical protein [Cyclobacteriaceae bacterium]
MSTNHYHFFKRISGQIHIYSSEKSDEETKKKVELTFFDESLFLHKFLYSIFSDTIHRNYPPIKAGISDRSSSVGVFAQG